MLALVLLDYNRAWMLTTRATTLSHKILDARLALTRLRQSHPHPRLTIPTATATLEAQITTMQQLDDEVQALNTCVSSLKEKMRSAKVEVEQVRAERAEVEKAVAANTGRLGDNDARVIPLYDVYAASFHDPLFRLHSLSCRYTAALAIHQSITSLLSSHAVSENELRLTYLIPHPVLQPTELIITLLFLPNTRRLAAAQVTGLRPDIDVGELVDSHVQVDDVQGLIAAILALARTGGK